MQTQGARHAPLSPLLASCYGLSPSADHTTLWLSFTNPKHPAGLFDYRKCTNHALCSPAWARSRVAHACVCLPPLPVHFGTTECDIACSMCMHRIVCLQVKYVVELARTLAHHPMVYRVDLLTRLITNDTVDSDYGVHEERISEPNSAEPLQGAFIVRMKAGNPNVYIAKEALWPHVRECCLFIHI